MRSRLVKIRGWAWKLAIPAAGVAVAGQLVLAGPASAIHTTAAVHHNTGTIAPAKVNMLDCNGWSAKWQSAAPGFKRLCTDPIQIRKDEGKQETYRFTDNGHYVGHDEPSVKFISSEAGSGNTMTYGMRLPRDPRKAPTPSGSVTKYGELSIAPWFGLPMCDDLSYPQNPCASDSDSNSGAITNPAAAGAAFMEMQFYPPGFSPFIDGISCSKTQWCGALTIDSLSCTFNFMVCNNNCIEPVNFSFLQTDGIPPGSPAPQDPSVKTFLGNSHTLKMNAGDVLVVSLSDPSGGFTVKVQDLTTGKTGFMQASAANGFTNTNGIVNGAAGDCSGNPHTWHAEYSSAKKQNQVPWAALEGGVLMQQEVGHFESCNSVTNRDGFASKFSDGSSYLDPKAAQTCVGGVEGHTASGKPKAGEGPCNPKTGFCRHAETQGLHGPVACPSNNFASGALCEFADGYCFPKGDRAVTINGTAAKEVWAVPGCIQTQFQNGDLDFDGNTYRADWPNGSSNHPQTFRYIGPITGAGHTYPSVQFETDLGGSERLCNVANGNRCTAPPLGARFYPFWSLNNKQVMKPIFTKPGVCVWNFGNVIKGLTKTAFGKDKQYGKPDVARYGGTLASRVIANPSLGAGCRKSL